MDDKNNLLHKIILNKTNTSDLNFNNNNMLVKDNFYITFKNNYNKIKIILDLYRVYRHGTGFFNLELINKSFVNIRYLDKNDISLKIEKNESDISSNLLKIGDNENNISSNLLKIGDNENNISSNLSKIGNNENNISSNLSKIRDNENNISANLSKIGDNESNISSNLLKIGNNENNISSNLSKIGNNENNISSNLSKIGDNENNISSNLEKINNIKEFLISPEDFKKTFNIEKQIFSFNKTRHFYTLFEKEIEYNFTRNSLLFINNNIYYKYENLLNDYHRLQHEYNIYDDENNLIYKYLFNKDTYYDKKQTLFY